MHQLHLEKTYIILVDVVVIMIVFTTTYQA